MQQPGPAGSICQPQCLPQWGTATGSHSRRGRAQQRGSSSGTTGDCAFRTQALAIHWQPHCVHEGTCWVLLSLLTGCVTAGVCAARLLACCCDTLAPCASCDSPPCLLPCDCRAPLVPLAASHTTCTSTCSSPSTGLCGVTLSWSTCPRRRLAWSAWR